MLRIEEILLVLIFKKETGSPPYKKQILNQPNPDLATTTLALPITLTLTVQKKFFWRHSASTAALEF